MTTAPATVPTLRGERVTLRPMTYADAPHLVRWANDPDFAWFQWGRRPGRFPDDEAARRWIDLIVEYIAGFAFGLLIFQSLFMKDMMGGSYLAALKRAAARVPVVVTVRPERGSILHSTYAFEGAERDLRNGPLICAAALTPAAARMKLMACLGAGYARGAIASAFVPDDF